METLTYAPHAMHRVRWTYDTGGKGTPTCLDCNTIVQPVMRRCPRCGTQFDGTSIGAALEARILCADCSIRSIRRKRQPR